MDEAITYLFILPDFFLEILLYLTDNQQITEVEKSSVATKKPFKFISMDETFFLRY
jgi:hypothetical protein